MRIRLSFAGQSAVLFLRDRDVHTTNGNIAAFILLSLGAASLGLTSIKVPTYHQSDKLLHGVTFLLMTVKALHSYLIGILYGLGQGVFLLDH